MPLHKNNTRMKKRTGGEIVAHALAAQGIRHAFCVPGESYLPLLAALPDAGITAITCRHEGAASMAAEAMGRLSDGVPGLCLVTRAPGLANAMAGITIAALDATPLVVLAGQVPTRLRGTQAFQEADLAAMAQSLCKQAREVERHAELEEAIILACEEAASGTPGPVMLSLPEDILYATDDSATRPLPKRRRSWRDDPANAAVVVDCIGTTLPSTPPEDLGRLLGESTRPLLIAGGGPHLWTERARTLLHTLGERASIPLITAFRRQGLVDPLHPAAAGSLDFRTHEALKEALRQTDLLILLGTRITGVTRRNLAEAFDLTSPPMPVVYIYPDSDLFTHWRGPVDCGNTRPNISATHQGAHAPEQFLSALLSVDLPGSEHRRQWMQGLHEAFMEYTNTVPPVPEGVNPAEIFIWLRRHLPPEAIVTSGAGNYSQWLQRFHHYRNLHAQLAPISGYMGYGLPAALAARKRFPERPVIAVAGDGCFQMSMADFATAAQHRLGIIVLVLDNGQLGTIRANQMRLFPGCDCGLTLHNPDFAAFAEACGGFGTHVHETAAFMDAFRAAERAAARGQPALLHVHVSPAAIAPGINAGE